MTFMMIGTNNANIMLYPKVNYCSDMHVKAMTWMMHYINVPWDMHAHNHALNASSKS